MDAKHRIPGGLVIIIIALILTLSFAVQHGFFRGY
jgi:hypothetical protein